MIVGVALVLILVLGAVGGGVWWRSRPAQAVGGLSGLVPAMEKAACEIGHGLMRGGTVAARFVRDLRAQRWYNAYQPTFRGFRQRVDEASLERLLKDNSAIKGPITFVKFDLMLTSGGGSITFEGALSAPKGGVWLLVIEAGGMLKTDRMSLEDKTLP
jgi:hypothetical protein